MTSSRRTSASAVAALAVATLCAAVPGTAALAAPADSVDGADVTTVARILDADGRPTFVEVERDTAAQERSAAAAMPGSVGYAVDVPVSIAAAPDPERPYQWANDRLHLDHLPAVDTSTQLVAVLDTGILADHEDFAPGQVRCDLGADFTGEGVSTDGCVDPHGHGTHVAGIVGAAKGNGKGVEGTAPAVPLMPVRVLNSYGGGGATDIAEGIVWAVDHGATVINMSLAGPSTAAYDDAVAWANSQGVVVVAAAGNNRNTGRNGIFNAKMWPAAAPGVVSVVATDSSDTSAGFSNSNDTSDVAAPGNAIYGLDRTSAAYIYKSGTSMAAPVVAAAAALYRAAHPGATEAATTAALTRTADDLETPGRDDNTGWGMVDPYQLVTGAEFGKVVPSRLAAPRASAGDAVVDLGWTAGAKDPAAPVTGYRLYRDGTLVAQQATTTFRDTSVVNGTDYAYAVSAYGPGGESERSSGVTVRPLAPVTPTPGARLASSVVKPGQRLALTLSDYRAASTVTVTEQYTVVKRVAVKTSERVNGRTVTRTTWVYRDVPTSTVLGRYRVGKTGGASVGVTPVRGVSTATLVVTGTDTAGAAASTEIAIKVG